MFVNDYIKIRWGTSDWCFIGKVKNIEDTYVTIEVAVPLMDLFVSKQEITFNRKFTKHQFVMSGF